MHRMLTALLAVFVFASAAAQTNHQVQMMTLPIEGQEIPAFFFEPMGLYVQPGDTITFVAAGPHHGVTAYHHRGPPAVPARAGETSARARRLAARRRRPGPAASTDGAGRGVG